MARSRLLIEERTLKGPFTAMPKSDLEQNSRATSPLKITASVVLYNTPETQLSRLLDCISNSSIAIETFLVDNSPQPRFHSFMRRPRVVYIPAESNRGYGAGHNLAMRQVLDKAAFHFVLNPDIYFTREELEKMVWFMEENLSVGHLMPKIVYPDGGLQHLCKLIPTPADLFLRRFAFGPLKKVARHRTERYELRQTNYDKVMDVPSLSGCFMLFRIAALHSIGLFDERFFMYLEDVDISRRMHTYFRTVFYPGAIVSHDHARESYKSREALWVHMRNSIRYFNKWGWIHDPLRSRINRETLLRVQCNQERDKGTTKSALTDHLCESQSHLGN
jgi:GT2 family glycosyltransferase